MVVQTEMFYFSVNAFMIWLLDPQKSISLYQKSQCFFLKRLSLEMIRIIECILPSCYHYRNCYRYRYRYRYRYSDRYRYRYRYRYHYRYRYRCLIAECFRPVHQTSKFLQCIRRLNLKIQGFLEPGTFFGGLIIRYLYIKHYVRNIRVLQRNGQRV